MHSPYGTVFCLLLIIYLHTLVVPVVDVTADRTRVGSGSAATLTCTVTRGNPMTYTYSWTHEGAVLPGETSATLSLTSFSMDAVGAYTCEVMNDAGSGMGSITIELGGNFKAFIPCLVGVSTEERRAMTFPFHHPYCIGLLSSHSLSYWCICASLRIREFHTEGGERWNIHPPITTTNFIPCFAPIL